MEWEQYLKKFDRTYSWKYLLNDREQNRIGFYLFRSTWGTGQTASDRIDNSAILIEPSQKNLKPFEIYEIIQMKSFKVQPNTLPPQGQAIGLNGEPWTFDPRTLNRWTLIPTWKSPAQTAKKNIPSMMPSCRQVSKLPGVRPVANQYRFKKLLLRHQPNQPVSLKLPANTVVKAIVCDRIKYRQRLTP